MTAPQIILVNEMDQPVGVMNKLEAHQKGLLHRAFSIFIFNSKGEMLLQQRASNKYHSSGLWTNACCSHPVPGEDMLLTAERRLNEEMGFATKLDKLFDFIYRSEFDNGLVEFEYDHVFVGEYDGPVNFNRSEVMDYCYKEVSDLRESLHSHPEKFSSWFQIAFPRMEEWWYERYKHQVA